MINPKNLMYPNLALIEDLVDTKLQSNDWNSKSSMVVDDLGSIPSTLLSEYQKVGWDVEKVTEGSVYVFSIPSKGFEE
jgi:hypothetical protein